MFCIWYEQIAVLLVKSVDSLCIHFLYYRSSHLHRWSFEQIRNIKRFLTSLDNLKRRFILDSIKSTFLKNNSYLILHQELKSHVQERTIFGSIEERKRRYEYTVRSCTQERRFRAFSKLFLSLFVLTIDIITNTGVGIQCEIRWQ